MARGRRRRRSTAVEPSGRLHGDPAVERLDSPCRPVTDLAEPAFIATAIKVRLGFR